jgi:hypothetical protein
VTVLFPEAYNEMLPRFLAYGIVVLISARALAACGGSGHFTPAEQAAITVVQRHNNFFRLFPDTPQTIGCRIQVGGPVTGYATGQCTTHISMNPRPTRLDFTEQTDGSSGSITLILDRHNRIVGQHWHELAQMRN